MKTIIQITALLVAVSVFSIITDVYLESWYSRWQQRRNYRRAVHPDKIEKNSQEQLELELQEFLLDEEAKEKIKSRLAHPASYKVETRGLDGSTRDILANLTNPEELRRRNDQQKAWKTTNVIYPNNSRKDRNDNYWAGE